MHIIFLIIAIPGVFQDHIVIAIYMNLFLAGCIFIFMHGKINHILIDRGIVVLQLQQPFPAGNMVDHREKQFQRIFVRPLDQLAGFALFELVFSLGSHQRIKQTVWFMGCFHKLEIDRRAGFLQRGFDRRGIITFQVNRQRGDRQSGRFRLVAQAGVTVKIDDAFLNSHLNGIRGSHLFRLIILIVNDQFHALIRLGRQPVGSTAFRPPLIALAVEVNHEGAGFLGRLAAQEAVESVEPAVGLELGILVVGKLAHCQAAAGEEVGIGDVVAGFLQHFLQRVGKHPALIQSFPGFLAPLASGEEDMAAGGDFQGGPALVQLGIIAVDIAVERALAVDLVGLAGREPFEGIYVAGAGAGVAAVEDHGDVRLFFRNLIDQNRQFLVGQIVRKHPALLATIVTDQTFVHSIGEIFIKRFGRFPLGPVPRIFEHHHIILGDILKVGSEGCNDIGISRLTVAQGEDAPGFFLEIIFQVFFELIYIVHAAGELADIGAIIADTDQQRI